MVGSLPYPCEPQKEEIREFGGSWRKGMSEFWGIKDVNKEAIAKLGVSGYLENYWSHNGITPNEIKSACGDADWLIEAWYDEEEDWEVVAEKIRQSLGVKWPDDG